MITLDTTKVGRDLGTIEVEVVGVATRELPGMGRLLILHAPDLACEDYPYDYCVVQESFLTMESEKT